MNTRSRTRLMGTVEVPLSQNVGTTSNVAINLEPAARNHIKSKAKGPMTRQNKLIVSPVRELVKKRPTTRVPKTRTVRISEMSPRVLKFVRTMNCQKLNLMTSLM